MDVEYSRALREFAGHVGYGEGTGPKDVCCTYRLEELTSDGRRVTASLIKPGLQYAKSAPTEFRVFIKPSMSNPSGLNAEVRNFEYPETMEVYRGNGWTHVQSQDEERFCARYLLQCLSDLRSREVQHLAADRKSVV